MLQKEQKVRFFNIAAIALHKIFKQQGWWSYGGNDDE